MKNQIIALFLGVISIQELEAINLKVDKTYTDPITSYPDNFSQINSEAFADAAVQARIEADSDISSEVKHHHMVNAESHNKSWKKHFKGSQFYQAYAQHNEEEAGCKNDCKLKKQKLTQIKSDYNQLSQKYDQLKSKADPTALAELEKETSENRPKDIKNLELEVEESFRPIPQGRAIWGVGDGRYGPAYPEPQKYVRGEKQWMDNGNNINDWGDYMVLRANSRLPYMSAFVQLDEEEGNPTTPVKKTVPQGKAPYGIATTPGVKGGRATAGPTLPIPGTFVRGEKQWQQNGNNINDWGDAQMIKANTRIPYQSAFVQIDKKEDEDKFSQQAPNGLAKDKETGQAGPALPGPAPFVRGEKQWMDNAANVNEWLEKYETTSNTRIPYHKIDGESKDKSSFVQIDSEMNGPNDIPKKVPQGLAPYGLAVSTTDSRPGPAYPIPQAVVRGEKQWTDNANNINDWSDYHTMKANVRIPYMSAFVQLPTDDKKDATKKKVPQGKAPYGLALTSKDKKTSVSAPALPSPPPFVRGEKQWMENLYNINTWGDNMTLTANTRLPYNSSFVQIDEQNPKRPVPQGPALFGLAKGKVSGKPGPAYPQPGTFIRGEKQWQQNGNNINDWGDAQMIKANTRIPYQSAFVQIADDEETENKRDENKMYEDGVDLSILYEKEQPQKYPTIEKQFQYESVPLDTRF